MMRAVAIAASLGLAFVLVAGPVSVSADDGDSAAASRPVVAIGEQFVLTIEVRTPAGATVEIDSATASWGGVEVVRVVKQEARPDGDIVIHRIQLVAASFAPGELAFRPSVSIVAGSEVTQRSLPPVNLAVQSTLPADAPLELSPLSDTSAIPGAESPLLRPGLAAAGAAGALMSLAFVWFIVRRMLRRRKGVAIPLYEPLPPPLVLDRAEALIESDPVGAYRALGSAVRSSVASRFGFPATALTTTELQRRMEGAGVDRWLARLVSGLLQECDAVVYAGYRPAGERRQADLTMAREILGEGS